MCFVMNADTRYAKRPSFAGAWVINESLFLDDMVVIATRLGWKWSKNGKQHWLQIQTLAQLAFDNHMDDSMFATVFGLPQWQCASDWHMKWNDLPFGLEQKIHTGSRLSFSIPQWKGKPRADNYSYSFATELTDEFWLRVCHLFMIAMNDRKEHNMVGPRFVLIGHYADKWADIILGASPGVDLRRQEQHVERYFCLEQLIKPSIWACEPIFINSSNTQLNEGCTPLIQRKYQTPVVFDDFMHRPLLVVGAIPEKLAPSSSSPPTRPLLLLDTLNIRPRGLTSCVLVEAATACLLRYVHPGAPTLHTGLEPVLKSAHNFLSTAVRQILPPPLAAITANYCGLDAVLAG